MSRAACAANIGAGERRKRLALGVVLLGLSLALLVVLVEMGMDRWWRLVLMPVFWGAVLAVLQWREATCIQLAARGARKVTDTIEYIADATERARLRSRARWIAIRATAIAALLTCGALALPR